MKLDGKLYLDEAKVEYDAELGLVKMPQSLNTGTYTLLMDT